ncbi:MAG: NAD-dependent epimerase/dehydratase family protein [Sphingobacteriia bacterium]
MKILVTGGAGFIGSNLVDELLKLNNNVLVVDNFLTGLKSNLSENDLLRVCSGSIEDINFLEDLFKTFQPDCVIHAAVSYTEPDNHKRDINTNILGTVNIIECSKKYDVKKIIFYQTSLCYGVGGSDIPLQSNTPYLSGTYRGASSYAITKISAELFLEMSGLNFISFRLANVYGPRNFSGPIPTFYKNILNGIDSKVINSARDFIFINDVISCTVKAIYSEINYGFFNISTGLQTKIKDIYNLVSAEMTKMNVKAGSVIHSDIGSDDTKTIFIDSGLTKKTFNWEPLFDLNEGIKQTIEWYKINGIEKTFTHLKNINN